MIGPSRPPPGQGSGEDGDDDAVIGPPPPAPGSAQSDDEDEMIGPPRPPPGSDEDNEDADNDEEENRYRIPTSNEIVLKGHTKVSFYYY